MYIQCKPNKSRTSTILLYTLCLLYVLSTANVVADLVALILQVSNNSICNNIIFISCAVAFRYTIAANWLRVIAISHQLYPNHSVRLLWLPCSIYLSTHNPLYLLSVYPPKSSKIYRCWIMWGQNIWVVIIPSFLAITFLGQSINLHLINRFQLSPLATWIATAGATIFVQGQIDQTDWGKVMVLISFTTTITVNTLVTVLIVFRILKAFLEYKPRSVERTLGTIEDTKLRHAIFVIIESGMMLFAIQLLRFVLFEQPEESETATIAYILVIGINEMFNVIIIFVHFYFFPSTDNINLARASHQH